MNKYVSMRKINLDREMRESLDKAYEVRIHSPATYVFDFQIGSFPAFVVPTPQINALIFDIYKSNTKLSTLQHGTLPPIAIHWYITKILVDEIKLTNDMENVHSTRREVKEALDSTEMDDNSRYIRFSGMATKYKGILEYRSDVLKTCVDVRKLYNEFVEKEVVAESDSDTLDGQIFRKGPVFVQNSHGSIVHEGVMPESSIIECMEKALAILNDDEIPCFIRVAVFHYLFGYIHPFYNGNGRLSRYISSMLISSELDTIAGLRLSYVIKEHKREYDNLFKCANDKRNMGDLTDFVEIFLSYVSKAMHDMIENLDTSQKTIQAVNRMIANTPELSGNAEIIRILALNGIFSDDPLSMMDLTRHGKCSRPFAQKAIDAASDLGILTKTRAGHKLMYSINPTVWLEMPKVNQ